jgi:cell division protein FtsB
MDLRIKTRGDKRTLPGREGGLRILAERAPQAEEFAERVLAKLRPMLARLYEARTRLATAGIVILASWLFVHVLFGANGMMVYRQKRSEYHSLERALGQLQKENDNYAREIQQLKSDPATIEKEAREQLHYARPGEVIYVAPPVPPPPQPRSSDAAKR